MAFLFYFAGMNFISVDGKIFSEDENILKASDRSFRYGDGLFETMKVQNGRILLEEFHFKRLWSGMALLKMRIPISITHQQIKESVLFLCEKNQCKEKARVRLSVTRGNGGLYDDEQQMQFIIEASPLEIDDEMNERGLLIDIFPDARKSCDKFSNLKSANYLPYVMAACYAKESGLDDCLVLNTHDRICDTSIANVFWVKDGAIFTPPLSEGCVAGVMRRNILEKIKTNGYYVQEQVLIIDELFNAEEIFLSNAIFGIRWIGQFRDKSYSSALSKIIYKELVQGF